MNAATRRRRKRERENDRTEIVMRPGESIDMRPVDPEIRVIGYGPTAYLWVGNKTGECFALLDGRGLRKLAGRFRRTDMLRRKPAR